MCPAQVCAGSDVACEPADGVKHGQRAALVGQGAINSHGNGSNTAIKAALTDIEAANADLVAGLRSDPKRVPVRFLYDDRGSDLYEQITQLKEYYPYDEEKALLQAHSQEIIAHIPAGAVVVELGCGDGSKTAVLLGALAARDGAANVRFLGIDVSGGALQQATRNLQTLCPDLPAAALDFCEAEYLPGLAEARRRNPAATLCILWLGSSVGNFTPDEAAAFLADMRRAVGDRSALLLCTDLWKDRDVLHAAYDDSQGVTREFIINGMCHALRTLGHPLAARPALWAYEAVVCSELQQVEMWVEAQEDVNHVLPGVSVAKGERVLMEISRKFTPQGIAALAQRAGLCIEVREVSYSSSSYSSFCTFFHLFFSCFSLRAAGHLGVAQIQRAAADAAARGVPPLLARHRRPLLPHPRLDRAAHRPAAPICLLLRPHRGVHEAQARPGGDSDCTG